jgi:1-deoxy-D-xylulose-5-phosphate reductoisomerase
MKKKIIILGSTGSIGSTTIKIINRDKKIFNVILLTANKDYKKIFLQAKKINCKNILIYDYKNYLLSLKNNKSKNFKIFNNIEDFKKLSKKESIIQCVR